MDVNKVLQELKARPGFTDHVGMMLVHNGVVRGWSRKDHAPVSSVTVSHDQAKMDAICHEMEQRPGIFAIVAQANEGELQPGDDLLLLVVAGDIRENVKATFAELLDRMVKLALKRAGMQPSDIGYITARKPRARTAIGGGAAPQGRWRQAQAHDGHRRAGPRGRSPCIIPACGCGRSPAGPLPLLPRPGVFRKAALPRYGRPSLPGTLTARRGKPRRRFARPSRASGRGSGGVFPRP